MEKFRKLNRTEMRKISGGVDCGTKCDNKCETVGDCPAGAESCTLVHCPLSAASCMVKICIY